MLLQLENTSRDDVNKLLEFAKQNQLKLSLIDDGESYHLPGIPLSQEQITELIENSRKSGIISMGNAHPMIRRNYNAH